MVEPSMPARRAPLDVRHGLPSVLGPKASFFRLALCAFLGGCPPPVRTTAPGRDGVIELEQRMLGFEIGGTIRDVLVEEGEHVTADQALADLDDSVDRAQRRVLEADVERSEAELALVRAGARGSDMRSAKAELARAVAQVESAEREYQRRLGLLKRGSIAQALVDAAGTQLEEARASRDAIAERLRTLQDGNRPEQVRATAAARDRAVRAMDALDTRLSHYRLHAPEEGVVLDVMAKAGEIVAPGMPAIIFAQPKRPYVHIFVPVGKLAAVKIGQAANVWPDGETGPFAGQVETIAHTAEYTPRYLLSEEDRAALVSRVRVRIDDRQERLHAGVPCRVELTPSGSP